MATYPKQKKTIEKTSSVTSFYDPSTEPKKKLPTGIMGTVKRAKNAVIDKVSDAMTLRSKLKEMNAIRKAAENVRDIKTVRATAGRPDLGNESDPLFRARANVANLKADASIRAKKARK